MDIYHIWCDLKDGVGDLEFAASLDRYLGDLEKRGQIGGWRMTRRKLGLAPADLGEFHVMIECEDLAQLDRAFGEVAARAEPVESLHFGVNAMIRNARFALYRDFPDPVRQTGAEKF
mgnify:CR=1 FL=1|jgi:hypothetical protein|tara:strand:+ start:204 stop:554 length:351 start_codon:yes stop_codon:yes gene_type:complete